MGILDAVNSPGDIKGMDKRELETLCAEIRGFLTESVARTGGHLASNLGVVELTVALHRVYDTSRDKLVFDVGHQSYVHKLLTGRREGFASLRMMDGMSGFPKPSESVHDAFIAGHASNSISAATGMARARSVRGDDYDVVAVIGDGALTGGLAYEGLSDAGESGEPMVVILNDNGMSIHPNVGGMARMLEKLRVRPGYFAFKRGYRRLIGRLPWLYRLSHSVKEWLKKVILPHTIFEDMGFYYLGPVDGHDLAALEAAIRWARELAAPVLLHVITRKGKGVPYAEANPGRYHGVGPFDTSTGELLPESECFSTAFGDAMVRLGERDGRVVAVTAAMENGTGLDRFASAYPDRLFDVGIAEGHAVTMAAGLACGGLLPVFAVYSTFLQRGYDMLIHDVSLMKLHAVFAVDRAGPVGRDGETHHGLFDVSYLGSVPGMTVYCPSSYAELNGMLETALLGMSGPVAVRYPRGAEGFYKGGAGGESVTKLTDGADVTLISYGIMINEALRAAEILRGAGLSCEVIKLNRIMPLDMELIAESVSKTARVVVAEDVAAAGCIGERILARLAESGVTLKAARSINFGDGIVCHGDVPQLLSRYGLDAEAIARTVKQMTDIPEGAS